LKEAELIAQEVSALAEKIGALERRLDDVEKVNGRLEQAALITARALQEISGHWDAVCEAMRREELADRDEPGAESPTARESLSVGAVAAAAAARRARPPRRPGLSDRGGRAAAAWSVPSCAIGTSDRRAAGR
jgi:hypothetical protein